LTIRIRKDIFHDDENEMMTIQAVKDSKVNFIGYRPVTVDEFCQSLSIGVKNSQMFIEVKVGIKQRISHNQISNVYLNKSQLNIVRIVHKN
jgi:hypothetical protein